MEETVHVPWRAAQADADETKAQAIDHAVAGVDHILDAMENTDDRQEILSALATLRGTANDLRDRAKTVEGR